MSATFRFKDPSKLEATLTVTMTIAQWKELAKQQPAQWPACDLAREIREVVSAAEQTFYPKVPE